MHPIVITRIRGASAVRILLGAFVLLCVVSSAGAAQAGAPPQKNSPAVPSAAILSGLSSTFYHSCGIKTDGTVSCWGYGSGGALAGTFTQVSAGALNTCGIKSDDTVACAGDNSYGQSSAPAGTFTQVSSGGSHTCGIKTDGTVTCWGAGKTNTNTDPDYGQAIDPSGTYKQLSSGFHHTCGIKTDNTVHCWGRNDAGQATDPTGTFTQISSSVFHTCGIKTDSTMACWGDDYYGQATAQPGTFLEVAAGLQHTCALKTDGTVICWGRDVNGQLDPPAVTFTAIRAGGGQFACGIMTVGAVVCWGDNYGQAVSAYGGNYAVSYAFLNKSYSDTLPVVGGGIAPYLFTQLAGALPDGLALAADGTLSGAPTAAGDFSLTAVLNDANGVPGIGVYPLKVCASKPDQPTLYTPADNAAISKKEKSLDWSDAVCATRYKVIIKNAATGATVRKIKATDSHAAMNPPLPAGNYKWFVKACNPLGLGCAKSAAFKFTR